MKRTRLNYLFLPLFFTVFNVHVSLSQTTYLVTNTGDDGIGSLRHAINLANSDGVASIIEFDGSLAGQPIYLHSELPTLTENYTNINGDIGNDGIPDIEIHSSSEDIINCIVIESANNTIRGLIVSDFWHNQHWTIGGGINISGPNASANQIKGCYIGVIGGNRNGIKIEHGANNNTIGGTSALDRNIISNNQRGILLSHENTNENIIIGNYIGTFDGVSPDPNRDGIYLYSGPSHNRIGGVNPGEANIIHFNDRFGINIIGYEAPTNANTITRNSISQNGSLGINLAYGANNNMSPPQILDFDGAVLYGYTDPFLNVEIFCDPYNQGEQFLGVVTSDEDGEFIYSGPFPEDQYINATVTDLAGNTSEFSTFVRQNEINANRWRVQLINDGRFARDLRNGTSAGGEFPKDSDIFLIYSGGHYLGTLKNGTPSVSHIEYDSEYLPGKITNSSPAPLHELSADNPAWTKNKVFVIDSTRSGDDWDNWPIDDGAPVDENGEPLLVSSQDSWVVFNDLNPFAHSGTGEPVLGLEVHRSTQSFTVPAAASAFLVHWKITNKSTTNYTDTYFGAWFDVDLDDHRNDFVGTDTDLDLVFCYNADDSDAPEAFGVCFLQGPFVDGRSVGFTASSSMSWPDDWPQNDDERYNLLQGLDRWGNPKPFGPFAFTGDPVTNSGNLDWNSKDKSILMNSGPFTLYAGNTQSILVACIGAIGNDRLDAVSKLKDTTRRLREFIYRPTVFISNTKGVADFKIPVRISLNGSTNLLGAEFEIQYDPSLLSLDDSDVELTTSTEDFNYSVNVIPKDGIANIALANANPTPGDLPDVLVKLPFLVDKKATAGVSAELKINKASLTLQGDFLYDLSPSIVNGGLLVVDNVLFGDVDQNGMYSITDAVLILKVLVEMLDEFSPFQELLADADQNGRVTIEDALVLMNEVVLNKPLATHKPLATQTLSKNNPREFDIHIPVVQGSPEQVVQTTVHVSKIDQLLGLDLIMKYDKNALQLESVESMNKSDLIVSNLKKPGRIHLAIINQNNIGNSDGDLVELTFTVIEEGEHIITIQKSEGVTADHFFSEKLPEEFVLYQNHPNPFNPSTKIIFTLPEAEQVMLQVYNALGQKVATLLDRKMNRGLHELQFDASDLPTGVYFYHIKAGDFRQVRKMVLLR